MDYSPGIRFETIPVNMEEAKEHTKSNKRGKSNQKQQRRCRCGSLIKILDKHVWYFYWSDQVDCPNFLDQFRNFFSIRAILLA